ncbi:MAG: DUF1893 domain-containing protein [Muribaculaceae bacterium]
MRISQTIIDILHSNECSCIILKDDDTSIECHRRGVIDLYELLMKDKQTLEGAAIADKVVGKGAAAIMVAGKVSELYADVISKDALGLLAQHGIATNYGKCVDFIVNSQGTGRCPVETLCIEETSVHTMIMKIGDFINSKL